MKIIETQDRKTEVVTDVICDCCGESCKKHETKVDFGSNLYNGNPIYNFEYLILETYWGYYSENKDTEKWTAHICEKCVDEKLDFINFKKESYI